MLSHIVFGVLALLYYLLKLILRTVLGISRSSRRHFRAAHAALGTLVRHHGGTLNHGERHSILWTLPDGSRVGIRRTPRSVIHIDIPIATRYSLTCKRIPRMFYAFAEDFIPEDYRIGATRYFVYGDPSELAELKDRPEFVRLLERLSYEGYSVTLTGDAVRASKQITDREANDIAIFEQMRLLRDLARACGHIAPLPLQAAGSVTRCAYCHEEAPNAQDVIHCAVCATPHHQECFELNGKCSVFGCGSARPAEPLRPTLVAQ